VVDVIATAATLPTTPATPELTCGDALGPAEYAELRQRIIFECGKWDPQYGDTQVLAEFPLVLSAAAWGQLAGWSERLAAETLAAEAELLEHPELHAMLGMPRAVRWAMAAARRACRQGPNTPAPRFMRFDFHPTTDGWRISEVNSDVPGGFIEASGLARLMASHALHAEPAGDPAQALCDALAAAAGDGGEIGLVHATAYTDDRQVMAYVARLLEARGLGAHLLAPDHVRWLSGRAVMHSAWRTGPLDCLLRFFPAEWLPNLPRHSGWQAYFGHPGVPLSNPGAALLTQSKRFPLAWEHLRTPLPTWRMLLPETRDPRQTQGGEEWVLKPALGRVGEGIVMSDVTPAGQARAARLWSRLLPRCWAAQQRFCAVPVEQGGRRWYPCIGVFVIDGRAAGAYGRIAKRPLISSCSRDVAVLVAAPHTRETSVNQSTPASKGDRPHGSPRAL
jgi:glutathionylspermidine synthase